MLKYYKNRFFDFFISGLTVISLLGTVTGLIPISIFLSILVLFSLPFVISLTFIKAKIANLVFWLYFFYFISFLSVLIYDPKSLISFDFYRRDGNFIVSYAPLLILPYLALNLNTNLLIKYLLYLTIFVNFIPFLYYIYTSGLSLITNDTASFGSLFVARNAAGGFLAVISGLAVVNILYSKKKIIPILEFFVVSLMLFFTYSRGSLLGLILGLLALFLFKTNRKILIGIFIIFPLAGLTGAATIWSYLNVYQPQVTSLNIGDADSIKEANIYIRLYNTWPRALQQFLSSPIVGTGFGSHDDLPYKLVQVFPGFSYNAQPIKVHTDSHAHHSYLHILGEQGLFGLFIFLSFWFAIYRYLVKNNDFPMTRDFLLLTFFILTIESFTEHRITTPSNVLPFSLTLGVYMAKVNFLKRSKNQ